MSTSRTTAQKSIVHHEEWLEALGSFREAIDQERNAVMLREAPRLLEYAQLHKDDEASMPQLIQAIQEAYWQALLSNKEFETVLQQDTQLSLYGLYALYRLERYDELEKALKRDAVNDNPALQHLHAQTLFHTDKPQEALAAYAAMKEANAEVWTNRVAVQAANCLLYVSTMEDPVAEEEQKEELDRLLSSEADDDYPYDLALNLATLEVSTATSTSTVQKATQRLMQAEAGARAQVEDPVEQASELAPIATNLAWSRAFSSGTVPSLTATDHASAQVQWVQQTHAALRKAVALPLIPADVKVSPLQRRLAAYNDAVLQLTQKPKECHAKCVQMLSSLASLKKRKADAGFSGLPPDHVVWWKTRLTVLQAHAALRLDQAAAAAKLMDTLVTELVSQPVSTVRDASLGYAVLHASVITKGPMEWSKLPESWQHLAAVRATRAALLFGAQKQDEAVALLTSNSSNSKDNDDSSRVVLADFWLSQGKFPEAAQLYGQIVGIDNDDFMDDQTDVVLVAKWVQALSHENPKRACEIWKQVQQHMEPTQEDEDDGDEDGAALEVRELPRLKTRKTVTAAPQQPETESSKQASQQAVLARRARKRQAYLTALEQKGLYRSDRPTAPNPERWIPKYERSHSRRSRRGGGPHRGAQGGVSEADALKLDVAARLHSSVADAAATSRSTAHMGVAGTGGPRKQKGRRK